jgi:hypothetical protein
MNTKAMVQDIAFWAIIVFIAAIILVVGAKLNTSLTSHYQASDAGTVAKEIQQKASARYYSIWDNSFLFIFILLGLSIVIVLYYVTSQPALFFVGLVLLAIVAIPIGIIGNAFDSFQDNDMVSDEAAQMPILGWLMSHILEIGIGIAILGIILLFARVGGGY